MIIGIEFEAISDREISEERMKEIDKMPECLGIDDE